jgi:hypothetical protein
MSGLGPESSAIKMSHDLEKRISSCSSAEQIGELLREAAKNQGLVRSDIFNPDVLIPIEPSGAMQQLEKTIVVDGVSHVIRGKNEGELAHGEAALFRNLFAQKPVVTEQPRDTQGRFLSAEPEPQSAEEVARNAELEMQFRFGNISAADYLEKSGAIEKYEHRRENEKLSANTLSWKQATDEFIHSEAARNYPGGEDYLRRMYDVLLENGWEDSPTAETLASAWQILQREDYEQSIAETVNAATDKFALRDALQPGSSLFGR